MVLVRRGLLMVRVRLGVGGFRFMVSGLTPRFGILCRLSGLNRCAY